MADTEVNTPAPLIAEEGEHTYKFGITMTCGGCSGAVDRVLKKLDGVRAYEVDLTGQTATVIAKPELGYETVLNKIAKTGKKINTAEADGEVKSVEIKE
ncbi:3b08fbae-b5f3-4219-b5cb-680806470938 [Sclerotinia trifoliorum]|uniref:3b08fbae-b5f3-4219-b5cb-680806470938 n=1 Tax=Sclerotinia trifoliorum TaxID=28548 RepID=A0A8H2VVH7_9HELO|nr:3b08fbae-b5f3-4219-b5cb-680806470938 [Sclerotinia trifoliorum]